MKIGITGATGFLGAALSERLDADHEVWRLVRRASGRSRELLCDLSHPAQINLGPVTFDVLIHAAGIVGASASLTEGDYQKVNVAGTQAIYERAAAAGVRRIILMSSGAVYCASQTELSENSPTDPLDIYGQCKLQAEIAAAEFADQVETVVMRLFFPYGPGQRAERLVPRLIDRIIRQDRISLSGETGPRLSLTFVEDVVGLTQAILNRWQVATINVVGPESATIRDIANCLGNHLNREPLYIATPCDSPSNMVASPTLAEALFDYRCTTLLGDGLRKTVANLTEGLI